MTLIFFFIELRFSLLLPESTTGKFLKDTGALPHIQLATTTTLHYSARGYQWAEANVPVYYKHSKDLLLPYFDLTLKVGINVWNNLCDLVAQKTPIIAKFVSLYPSKSDLHPISCTKIYNLSISRSTNTFRVHQNQLVTLQKQHGMSSHPSPLNHIKRAVIFSKRKSL